MSAESALLLLVVAVQPLSPRNRVDDSGWPHPAANANVKKVKPPPPSTSTVLLRLDASGVPHVGGTGWRYTFLQVVNEDSKKAVRWYITPGYFGKSIWVAAYAAPGRYLVTDYVDSTHSFNSVMGSRDVKAAREVRYEVVVPASDWAVFYGTVSFSSVGAHVERGIDAEVRDFYGRYVPFKRSALVEGEIKAELDRKGDTP
jgi:hypothetical protein